jgi:hypothetical protein
VIHAAQLAHERAPLPGGFPAREAGHARDHVPLIRLAVPRTEAVSQGARA